MLRRSASSSSTTSTVRVPAGRPAATSSRSAVGERLGAARRAAGTPAAPAASRSWRRSSSASASTGRWRVRGSRLRRPSVSGSSSPPRPSTITSGPVLLRERERGRRAHRHEALEAGLARGREQGGGAVDVAVDDQRDAVALARPARGRRRAASARRLRRRPAATSVVRRLRRRARPARARRRRRASGSSSVNVEPSPSVARHADLAAEQARDLAADRQAEAGAAVAAAGRPVGLLEGLEDQPQLVLRDADAGVGDRERDARTGARAWSSSSVGADRRCRTLPLLGELERVGRAGCAGPARRAGRRRRSRGSSSVGDLDRPARGPSPRPPAGTSARGPSSTSAISSGARWTSILPASTLDRSRMSEISVSRSVPAWLIVRANSTCWSVRLLARVVGQQLGQDQQRVQRRAQLVAHVGQELALVARGQRELLGALLQRQARALDLGVLDLDVAVLLGEQRRLLLQLLVGLAQLLLLGLQQLLGRAQRLAPAARARCWSA